MGEATPCPAAMNVREKLLAMARLAEDMVDRSVKALLEGDAQLARQVCEDDDQLDALENEVDRLVLTALRTELTEGDLRLVTLGLKISNDLERVGDQANSVAEAVIHLSQRKDWQAPLRHEIVAMGEKSCLMLREACRAFSENDVSLARQLINQDDQMDALRESHQDTLVKLMQSDTESISFYLNLGDIIKRLERVADHATNVAEGVLFMNRSGEETGTA